MKSLKRYIHNINKAIALTLALLLAAVAFAPQTAIASGASAADEYTVMSGGYTVMSDEYTVMLDGRTLELTLPIINLNNRLMYPFRECLEAMGALVGWDDENRVAYGILNGNKVEFPIDSNEYRVNGATKNMDEGVTAFIRESRTYIPIRYAAEGLGYEVLWDEETSTAHIKTVEMESETENESESETGTGTETETEGAVSGPASKIIMLVEPTLDYKIVFDFSEGLARVFSGYIREYHGIDDYNGHFGFIDKNGEVAVPLEYSEALDFCDGLAGVEKDGKWGFIDKAGIVAVPIEYDGLTSFSEGLACVTKDGKYGFVDKTGNAVTLFEYDDAAAFSEGLAAVAKNGKCGFIDKTGKVAIPIEYDYVYDYEYGHHYFLPSFSEGLVPVGKDGRFGYIDKTGAVAVPFEYGPGCTWNFSEGLAFVWNDGFGYIDKSGKVVIPLEYQYAYEFNDGLAFVYIDSMKNIGGFIDATGKMVLPTEYDIVESHKFIEGLSYASIKDEHGLYYAGYFNKAGEVIVPFEYEDARSFSEGYACVKKYGRYGFIDKTGEAVVPFEYNMAGSFNEGLAVVQINFKWGILQIVE